MTDAAHPVHAKAASAPSRAVPVLGALAGAALLGAGALLWAVHGPAAFAEIVLAAVAACF